MLRRSVQKVNFEVVENSSFFNRHVNPVEIHQVSVGSLIKKQKEEERKTMEEMLEYEEDSDVRVKKKF